MTHHNVLVRRARNNVLFLKFYGVGSGNIWNKIERMFRNEPTCLRIRMPVSRSDGTGGKIPHILQFRIQHRELHGASKV